MTEEMANLGERVKGMSGPGVVGRTRELARADAFVNRVRDGAAALIVSGDAGIGKTALWRAVIDRCQRTECRVLVSRPAEDEMPLPLVGLMDLFDDVPVEAPALDPSADPLARGRAVLASLRGLTRDAPTIVAIDDLQWLDSVSAHALRFALRRIDVEPIGVLVTVRGGSEAAEGLASSLPPGRTETLDLAPLALDDLRRVVSAAIPAIPRPLLRRIHEVSGGNPLYALELARSLAGEARASSPRAEFELPHSLQAAIARRFESVPDEVFPMLEVVSVMGRVSISELQAILPGHDVDGQIVAAQAAGLIVVDEDLRLRFAHPLLGSAFYGRMGAPARRALHGVLAGSTPDPDARARHLALSVDEPDEEVARLLEQAAARARAQGAFDVAAHLDGHARRITPAGDPEALLRRALDEIADLAAAGDEGRALLLADQVVAELDPGPLRARALLQRYQVSDDDSGSEEAWLQRALIDAGDDERLRAQVLELLGREHRYRGDLPGAVAFERQAHEAARRLGDRALEMTTTAFLAFYEALAGTPRRDLAEDAVGLEEELGSPALFAGPRLLLSKQRLWAGDLDSAAWTLRTLRAESARGGSDFNRRQIPYDLALVEIASGRFAEAWELVTEGLEASRDAEDPTMERMLLYPLSLVHAWRGMGDEARATAGRHLELSGRRGERDGAARAHGVLGLLALSEGDAPAAARELAEAAALLEAMGIGHPGAYPILPDAVEAAASAGDVDGAGELLERLERQAETSQSAWALAASRRARGAVLLSRGDADEAAAALRSAAEDLDALGFTPDACRAQLLLGRAFLRAGHRSRAAEVLARSRDRFRAMEAVLWGARATEELERAAPGRAVGELTPVEARVTDLVARGLRNREVAATLFMSVATVEAHLTRIYRKLGIRSRAELSRLVADGSLVLPAPEDPPDAP
jgi:DNA-binding NarL/FixJ family response regulator